MIEFLRERFNDDVEQFTDAELMYFIGYEHIPMTDLASPDTIWKLRSWGKYENYLDAAEEIFDENDEYNLFTEAFYEQDLVEQFDQAREALIKSGYPMLVTDDCEVWVKRIDW